MWFNVYFEWRGIRENKPEFFEFIKKFSLLLLIFAYVTGSLSGVGIWFATTVSAPRGISALIHNYVWAWATEWVFFIMEVIGIFVYYYTIDRIDRRTHLKLGLIFALASYPTMMIIVGILSFMLTPGRWLETGNFLDGIFNPSYFYQLFLRTAFMFAIGATYAIAVATRIKNQDVRIRVVRVAGLAGIGGLIAGTILLQLFVKHLLADRVELMDMIVSRGLKTTLFISIFVLVLYFVYAYAVPLKINLVQAVLTIVVLFSGIFTGERIREILRKPYIIPGFMYSNQIIGNGISAKGIVSDVEELKNKGVLKKFPFVPEQFREINENNLIEAGRIVALVKCSACHVLNEHGLRPLPQMVRRLELYDPEVVDGFLEGLGSYPYMPPFTGTDLERKALAHFLVSLNKGVTR
jgi:cytochrome bd-type quinol oxidase subunit 1